MEVTASLMFALKVNALREAVGGREATFLPELDIHENGDIVLRDLVVIKHKSSMTWNEPDPDALAEYRKRMFAEKGEEAVCWSSVLGHLHPGDSCVPSKTDLDEQWQPTIRNVERKGKFQGMCIAGKTHALLWIVARTEYPISGKGAKACVWKFDKVPFPTLSMSNLDEAVAFRNIKEQWMEEAAALSEEIKPKAALFPAGEDFDDRREWTEGGYWKRDGVRQTWVPHRPTHGLFLPSGEKEVVEQGEEEMDELPSLKEVKAIYKKCGGRLDVRFADACEDQGFGAFEAAEVLYNSDVVLPITFNRYLDLINDRYDDDLTEFKVEVPPSGYGKATPLIKG